MLIQKATTAIAISVCLGVIFGCQPALKGVFVNSADTDRELVNYARTENGAVLYVSEDNADYPASTLTDGITSAGNWDAGEGWQTHFDGAYVYGQYVGPGENQWFAERASRGRNQIAITGDGQVYFRQSARLKALEEGDYKTRGISVMGYEGPVSSVMGWAIIEMPSEKLVTRVILHTVDSEKYPAAQYGVRDFVVQYWPPQSGGWQNVERSTKKVGDQYDSIRDNKQGRVVVRFRPVKTSKFRVLIRWTNDTEMYRKTRFNRYVRGTVRLTEIEIFGLEKKDEIASTMSIQNHEDGSKTEVPAEVVPERMPEPPIDTADATGSLGAEVESVIRAYETAYRNRDLLGVMATISPAYSRGDEEYAQLKEKMESLFKVYTQLNLQLQRVRINADAETSTVTSDYTIALASAGSSTTSVSGKLFFTLKYSDARWQVTRIDTQQY